MSIVKMKRLRLVGMRSDREELLRLLQNLGCVEIDEAAGRLADPEWDALTRPDDDLLGEARQSFSAVTAALGILKKRAPVKSSLFARRPEITSAQLFDNAAKQSALAAAGEIVRHEQRVAALYAEESKIKAQKASLAPWLETDVPLETASTREVTVFFGTLPAGMDFAAMEGELAAASDLAQVTRTGADRDLQYIFFLCHKSVEEEAVEILKNYGFSRSALRGWTGTARENDRALDEALLRNERELAAEIKEIVAYSEEKSLLERCLDRLTQEINREENKGRLLDSGSAFFLDGWVPVSELEGVETLLGGYACAWETADPLPEEYPAVPVKLKNNKLTKPLNMVTNMYVLPAYDGVDPNPLMAPFFITFFGIMMADMGYGILMIAIGLFILLKMQPREGMQNFAGLAVLCGISTFIVGAMTGGFFGDFIPQLAMLLNPGTTLTALPSLFTPLEDTLAILVGSLALGLVQVITGMAVSVVRQVQAGNAADAFWNEVTWWVILAGIVVMALGKGSVVLIVGGLMLLYGSTRKAKGLGKVTALIGAVYNGATGFFSDILSYARLMALMLAGSVIAQVFNTLGSVFGNVVVFVIISFIGNMLNLALNLLGCYVHDMRLQCLEYFGRFYKEGGKPFKPLVIQTKYVDILKEEQ